MEKLSLIILLNILFVSCSKNEKFDSKKWIPYESGILFKHRKKSVFDLTHNVLEFGILDKKGTNVQKVRQLLGKPNLIEKSTHSDFNFYYQYEVEEKFEYNIDPHGGMDLTLYFEKDSTLVQWKINEYWYRP